MDFLVLEIFRIILALKGSSLHLRSVVWAENLLGHCASHGKILRRKQTLLPTCMALQEGRGLGVVALLEGVVVEDKLRNLLDSR